jgi:hypothetical protein
MKFLCLDCDDVMEFAERQLPSDGTLTAVFTCGSCGREVAMLTNPMETQLVASMGVKIGGREVPTQPLEMVRTSLEGGREEAFDISGDIPKQPSDPPAQAEREVQAEQPAQAGQAVGWSAEATERLEKVPSFVRGMVKRIYVDWAKENGVAELTPDVMDRARSELGLEGM